MISIHFVAQAAIRTVVTISILCLFAGTVSAAPTAEPQLVLDPQGLADEVDPGDIVATLGDVAIFWLDELDFQGTDYQGDDTVRLALWRTDGTPAGTFPLLPPEVSFFDAWPDPLNGVVYFTVCRAQDPISALYGAECNLPETGPTATSSGNGARPTATSNRRSISARGSAAATRPSSTG